MSFNATSVPKWLLEHFGIAQRNEFLVGDLIEEYNGGKSALWLWRETAWAVAKTIANDIRMHPVLALRAASVGWAVEYPFAWSVTSFQQHYRSNGEVTSISLLCMVTILPAIAGRIAALTKRGFAAAMVCSFVLTGLLQDALMFSTNFTAWQSSPNPHQLRDEIISLSS